MKFKVSVAVALVLVVVPALYLRQHYASLAADIAVDQEVFEYQETAEAVIRDIPASMELPRLSIELEVIAGDYFASEQSWSLSEEAAHFATMTEPVNNQAGNTLIYGHNTAAVLGKTAHIEIGDQLLITTKNGAVLVYELNGISETTPNDTSILQYEGAPQVTLVTCSGFFDQYRRLMTFTYKGVLGE